MLNKEEMLAVLRRDVIPALGCTEPVTVALAAADAAKALGGTPASIVMEVNPNIYKNGMSVGIPRFSRVGLEYAAALGALIADPSLELQVFSGITAEIEQKAIEMVEARKVSVTIDRSQTKIYARAEVESENGKALTIIKGSHNNIIHTSVNGNVLVERAENAGAAATDLTDKLISSSFIQLRELVETASEDELAFMEDGVKMNQAVLDFSLTNPVGVGINKTMQEVMDSELLGNSLLTRIQLSVAAAIEGRLDGCPYTVMSSAGSGSKGIAVILPIVETAKLLGSTRLQTLRALAYGHLLNSYINHYVGKLSAVCACSVAAATAASASMTWLMGGNDEQIGWAVRNMSGAITGMVCDGGKVGCGLKLATATSAAVLSAILAARKVVLRETDGICGDTPEQCVANMGRISDPGMVRADREILDIMLEKAK